MNKDICTNAIALTHPHRGINPSDNHTKENAAQGISVVSPQEVLPLLALPNEILVKIADGLTSADLRSLDLTSRRLHTVFNTEERLKILAKRYYGSAFAVYRRIIDNWKIPAVPNNVIKDPLLRLAYWRHTSNEFLKNNPEQTAVATLNGPARSVPSVTPLVDITLLPGGLLALSHYETIKVWDLNNQQCVMMLNGHTGVVRSVTLLADGLLASRSDDMTIKVWDMSKPDGQQCVATMDYHFNWLCELTQLSGGQLACGLHDGAIRVWDYGQQYVTTLYGHTSSVISVRQLPDGRLASVSHDETIRVWCQSTPDGYQCVASLSGHVGYFLEVLADGRLVSCSSYGIITVWDLSKPAGQECVATLRGHSKWVESFISLPDGRFASCSHDASIRVWDLSKPAGQECVVTLDEHVCWVCMVILLPDGRLASCSWDKTIRIWDLSKPVGQECVATLVGHYRAVHSMKLLPDGLLVSYSYDTTIKLWNIMSPDESIKQID